MINALFDFIKSNAQNEVINNPEVPNEMNDGVIEVAHDTIITGLQGLDAQSLAALQSEAQSGNLDINNPQINQFSSNLSGNLMEKLGLNSGIAKTIAVALIPLLLKKLLGNSGNAAPSNNGFSLDGILGNILGGGNSTPSNSGGGMLDNLSNIGAKLGLDQNGDGKLDLNDLGGLFKK